MFPVYLKSGLHPVSVLSGGWLLVLEAGPLLPRDGPGDVPHPGAGAGVQSHLPSSHSAGTTQTRLGLI